MTQAGDNEAVVVGIVGAGTMGAGIAQVCLQAGHEVLLHDVDHAAIERGRSRVADGLAKLVDKGRLTAGDMARLLGALRDAHALHELAAEADIAIEAALEDIDLKRTVFRALGDAARPDALLATNTSALSVSVIGEASGAPDRVVGLHFFNPAPLMPLVEVVVGDRTAASVVQRAVAFAEGLGKQPVVCADSPGFIVNRVNRPFTLEALRMLEAGDAGVERIDRAIKSAGYPMGPFELMDLVGIDVNFAVASALWAAFDEAERFRPSPIQRALVEQGRLGRKSGNGFYVYQNGVSTGLSPDLAGIAVQEGSTQALDGTDVVGRIELAIINEAYHAAGEGVAEPSDIDRAMKLGANHPHGPFERAGALGLRTVVEGLREMELRHGERYRVAPTLWQIASI